MSLAVLKRKTKETYKTKKGTFSLNGTKRNLSYVGKNYSGMTRNPYCFTNSTNIKKSVGSQTAVIRNLRRHLLIQAAVRMNLEPELYRKFAITGFNESNPTVINRKLNTSKIKEY